MGKQSFISKLRELFGGVAFKIFLWSIRMTQDEYLNAIAIENIDQEHSFYMRCWDCYTWGTPVPENVDTCGNCGGHSVTIYYPAICPTMLAPDKGQAAVVKVESGSAPCG